MKRLETKIKVGEIYRNREKNFVKVVDQLDENNFVVERIFIVNEQLHVSMHEYIVTSFGGFGRQPNHLDLIELQTYQNIISNIQTIKNISTMKPQLLILGNISFTDELGNESATIQVHEVTGVIDVSTMSIEFARQIGDDFESYVFFPNEKPVEFDNITDSEKVGTFVNWI